MLSKMMRISLLAILAGTLLVSAGCSGHTECAPQHIIGATAIFHVEEAGIDFVARIDTGARTTSIHALSVEIEDEAGTKEQNIGKSISFDLFDPSGMATRLHSTITDVIKVRNAQGVEYRYQVPLTLQWDGQSRTIPINLRDRSAMTYPLLIGRDYLSGMLVDVDMDKGE